MQYAIVVDNQGDPVLLNQYERFAVRFWGQMNGVIYTNYKAAMREFRPTRAYVELVQQAIYVR